MSDERPDKKQPESAKEKVGEFPESGEARKLTPEEQMALFEKELKETDWGHQPC